VAFLSCVATPRPARLWKNLESFGAVLKTFDAYLTDDATRTEGAAAERPIEEDKNGRHSKNL
jgi:hypothetical protein